MKHSSIEWLIKQLNDKVDFIPLNKWDEIRYLVQQAKAMHKEEIVSTWHNGYNNQSPMLDEDNCGEQYYNETFNTK